MATQRILLNDSAGQQFSTVIDGVRVVFVFRYNASTSRFYFSMAVDDAFIVQGRTLVTNVDLLASHTDVAATFGSLFCVDIDDKDREPTIENIANGNVRVFLKTDD